MQKRQMRDMTMNWGGLVSGDQLSAQKERARAWFERLRDEACAALEAIEDDAGTVPGAAGKEAGRFVRTPWTRETARTVAAASWP